MSLFQRMKDVLAGKQRPVVHIPDTPHTPPIRRRYRFTGRVQGVGFRFEAMMTAEQLKLTGWAKNQDDGSVLIEIEGEASYIDEFLRVMQSVLRFHITDIQMEELPVSGTETTFKPIY